MDDLFQLLGLKLGHGASVRAWMLTRVLPASGPSVQVCGPVAPCPDRTPSARKRICIHAPTPPHPPLPNQRVYILYIRKDCAKPFNCACEDLSGRPSSSRAMSNGSRIVLKLR